VATFIFHVGENSSGTNEFLHEILLAL